MQQVIGVKFHSNTKIYYFDPKDIAFNEGDSVIVETSRGLEFGMVATGNHFVDEENIVKPLKEVIRKATERLYFPLLQKEGWTLESWLKIWQLL